MSRGRIIVADDEKEVLDILEETLSYDGYEVFRVSNGKEVLDKLSDIRPDLILLDINMPGMDGMEVKSRMNKDTSTSGIPVIFLTGRDATVDKVKGLNLGADEYVTKPVHLKELLARVDSVLNRRKFYEDISMRDGLTGLHNIRFFNEQISIFFNLAKRYGRVFSLAIIDVDDFKAINDTHGHKVGDFVLKKLAEEMQGTLRKVDIITRYGGDEFAVILPGEDEEQAISAIKRLKDKIKAKEYRISDLDREISFTFSAGIAAYSEKIENESRLFDIADAKMYNDKKGSKR